MAYSAAVYLGDGSNTIFTVPFQYLDKSHIHVKVAGTETPFTWLTGSSVQVSPPPSLGVTVEVRRITPKDNTPVDFSDGAVLTERDLDSMATFALYCAQEAQDGAEAAIAQSSLGIALAKVYQGKFSSDPAVRSDGTALEVGDLYYNVTANTMRVYTGILWQDIGSTIPAVMQIPSTPVIAVGGETSVTVPGGYNPGGLIVHLNGLKVSSPEVNASNGTTIQFATPLSAGDEVDWIALSTFKVADAWTKAQLAASDAATKIGFGSRTVDAALNDLAINVKTFGAKGDGVADDTAAIQAAINEARKKPAVRAAGVVDPGSPYMVQTSTLFFPPGLYRVTSPLWFGVDSGAAGWNSSKIVESVFGYGAVILGQTNGQAVVDASGAFGMKWHGLTVFGDAVRTPKVGILLSRSGNAVGDNPSAGAHRFTDVNVHGDFSLACVYNYASEINVWTNCFLYQNSGKTVYLGTNNNVRHAVTSQYCTLAQTTQSAYGDFFNSCIVKSSTGNTTPNGAVFYLESLDYGPSIINSYIDTSGSVYMPSIFFRNAQGLDSSMAVSWNQSPRIIGCTFEYRSNQDIIAVDNGHVVRDLTIRGNTMPIDGSTGNRAHLVVNPGAVVRNLDAQAFSGDTIGAPFVILGTGKVYNKLHSVVPLHDDYIGTGWLLTEGDLSKDGSWYTLDLAGYGVPKTAKFVFVKVSAKTTAAAADNFMALRGSSSDNNARWFQVTPAVSNIEMNSEGLVPVVNGQIQYSIPANFNRARILIREYHI